MIATHIHDALGQIRELQGLILQKRYFTGYSGKAQIVGGFVTIFMTFVVSSNLIPRQVMPHLIVWVAVGILGMIINYIGIFNWYRKIAGDKRRWVMLLPVIDAVPSIAVAIVLSITLVMQDEFKLLFGTWMCLYGLAHMPYRQLLPRGTYAVGIYYVICGTVCLLFPFAFLNPWPMGIVFFIGELTGGIVLHQNREANQ